MIDFAIAQPLQRTSTTNCDFTSLLEMFPVLTFKKGEHIIREGQTQKYIYYIETGKVLSLTTYSEVQRELSNGYFLEQQFINLNALTTSQATDQSAIALSKTTIKKIPILAFHALMRKNSYLNQLVLHSIIRQAEKQKKLCHQMLLLSSNQRIIQFLIDYMADAGKRVGYEWAVRDFFTQHQIALLTNTARQTVSTLLNDLRRQNIIHFTKKYLIIRELEALKELALQS